jgi:hypothetical protein
MMGERTVAQEALFYEFSLEQHVPAHHLLRAIDRFVDLSGIRAHLRPPGVPKFISPADPAARWTAAHGGQAFFAYATNYLIDLKHAVIMDVEATTAVRQAEVAAARTMIDRTQDRFGTWPEKLVGDACGQSLLRARSAERNRVASSQLNRISHVA